MKQQALTMKQALITALLIWLSSTVISAQGDVPFITTWRTSSANETITIPINPSYNYKYDIDWGDGSSHSDVTTSISHNYVNAGIYQVSITGQFPAIYINNTGSKELMASIDQWGNIEWQSMNSAFYGAANMEYNATDVPNLTAVTDMTKMFRGASNFNGDIGSWDVSNVSVFSNMFRNASIFNRDIGSWDMNAAVKTNGMFYYAIKFNQDLSPWADDLDNVDDMSTMFSNATDFNHDIGDWDVSNVKNMIFMFRSASSFDQDISYWDIGEVTHMVDMLIGSGLSIRNYDKLLFRWAQQDVQPGVALGAGGVNYCVSQEARDSLTSAPSSWTITDAGQDCSTPRPFVTTWRTTTPNESITIPTNPDYSYNYNIDWDGDGNDDASGITGSITHFFAAAGDHEIAISGTFPAIYINNSGDKEKIINIDQWGDINWGTMNSAFYGAFKLNSDAYDTPDLSNVNDMAMMFRGAKLFDSDLGNWNVENVTDMSSMFGGAEDFNQDISRWDVDNVTDMSGMFYQAYNFNQEIGGWDVHNVTDMSRMFSEAYDFNQDISGWDVDSVTDMRSMFDLATDFNGDIGSWDVDRVTDMSGMFYFALRFNQDIGVWGEKVAKVQDMGSMFEGAENFNQDIGSWAVDSVTNMASMFRGATSFNGDIGMWGEKVSNVQDMRSMFHGATSFNQDIRSWNVGNVINMDDMFANATSFNQDIGGWDVSNVENMNATFNDATTFNQDISDWEVDSVVSMRYLFQGASSFNQDISPWNVSNVTNMGEVFDGATSFNQDISGWDVSNVSNMSSMFEDATSFNQDIGDWDVTHHINMLNMLDNSGISQLNYDNILTKWSQQNAYPQIDLGAAGLEFCRAESARMDLENTQGWSISGDSKNCINAQPCASTRINIWQGTTTGVWQDDNSWSQQEIPQVCDEVLIPQGSVTLIDDAECYSIEIAVGADVEIANHQLLVWSL